jgi:putative transcriptional regulator
MKRMTLINERRKRNLSTQDLANEIGVSKSMIVFLENCRCKPSIDTAFKLERFFGLTASELLVVEEERTAKT